VFARVIPGLTRNPELPLSLIPKFPSKNLYLPQEKWYNLTALHLDGHLRRKTLIEEEK